MLDGHVVVLQPLRLPLGGVEETGEALGDGDLPGGAARSGHPGAPGEILLEIAVQADRVRPGRSEQAGHQPVGLLEQRQEQVLAIHLGVTPGQGQGLGVVQRLL